MKLLVLSIINEVGIWNDKFLLQKLIFILQKKYKLSSYQFVRKDYGPFCEELQDQIDELVQNKTILENEYFNRNKRIIKLKLNRTITSQEFDPEVKSFIHKINNESRENCLNKIYYEFNIFDYELGDRI